MKCVICKGDDIRVQEVKEEIANGDDILQIRITIPVCRTCGERYYDLRTMQRLEETRAKLRKRELQVRQVGMVLEEA